MADSLAEKLDKDIDDFMDELVAKRGPNHGKEKKPFCYEEWEKEIDNHPAFMNELPKDGEMPEAIQALQALKYSDEDPPEVKAEEFKAEGNKMFSKAHFKWAVNAYTEGLKCKPNDDVLMSILYANRAAAHVSIGNHGSAFKDCSIALKYDENHQKAMKRGCECLLTLRKPAAVLEWLKCYEIEDSSVRSDLLAKAESLLKLVVRDERKRQRNEKASGDKVNRVLQAIKARNIQCDPVFDSSNLVSEMGDRVKLNEENVLCWQIILRYPGPDVQDIIQCFPETSTFREQLTGILSEPASFDPHRRYNMDNVRVIYPPDSLRTSGDQDDSQLIIDMDIPFSHVLSNPNYTLHQCYPVFHVVLR